MDLEKSPDFGPPALVREMLCPFSVPKLKISDSLEVQILSEPENSRKKLEIGLRR